MYLKISGGGDRQFPLVASLPNMFFCVFFKAVDDKFGESILQSWEGSSFDTSSPQRGSSVKTTPAYRLPQCYNR